MQAVDIVGGDIKVNPLPEEAHVVLNDRVEGFDYDGSVRDVPERLEKRYLTLLGRTAPTIPLTYILLLAADALPPNASAHSGSMAAGWFICDHGHTEPENG
ncbi:hypothetical protein C8F01DRAFT_1245467 [Mycena amicta]|nr:hypothetical protein C8F01DRAFT_1245467 [Mycena amicta]